MDESNKLNNGVYPTKLELSSVVCDGKPCKSRTERGIFRGPERVYLTLKIPNDELLVEDVAAAVKIVCQKALEYFC